MFRSMAAARSGASKQVSMQMRQQLPVRQGLPSSFLSSTFLSQQRHHQQQRQRWFSDRLLGHSPMAPSSASSQATESRIPTQQDVSVAGGVWNPTSAKRDKIAELKTELAEDQYTLDDAANDLQKMDLWLTDGVQWVVHTVDQTRLSSEFPLPWAVVPATITTSKSSEDNNTKDFDEKTINGNAEMKFPPEVDPTKWEVDPALLDVEAWMKEQQATIQSSIPSGQLNRHQYETYLLEVMQKLDEVLATLPAARYLRHIRDFYEIPKDTPTSAFGDVQQEIVGSTEQNELASNGKKLLSRYRLQLTRAMCEHLNQSWDTFTALTDEALDRLAVKSEHGQEGASDDDVDKQNIVDGKLESISLAKLNVVLNACLLGNASDRVDALWYLVDKDGDKLLEKTEMEQVATSAVTPVQWACLSLFEDALEAAPVRILSNDAVAENSNKSGNEQKQLGWRDRRRERKTKKRLLKAFQRTTQKHFEDEVEMPHRLRCIYAWSEKAHQDNKIDSVLIESSGWSGRKRYVELHPKISLAEFREVQELHFQHLDRIGNEITKSFREDLWVEQGTGRQNAELKRDCLLFLLVVSLVDYGIIIL